MVARCVPLIFNKIIIIWCEPILRRIRYMQTGTSLVTQRNQPGIEQISPPRTRPGVLCLTYSQQIAQRRVRDQSVSYG